MSSAIGNDAVLANAECNLQTPVLSHMTETFKMQKHMTAQHCCC